MGATFLDDADVNSREQCLRLCCETENCDVFVFEEKNQGTCFLFHCGPPTDFHCKFTHHSNYTSAVLKIPTVVEPAPPVQPLVSQIHSLTATHPQSAAPKLSQHELELVNLKAPKTPTRTSNDLTSTTLIPPLGVQLGQVATTTSTPRPSTPAQCGHYEFPCHSGECIAVYNACDGIPQCADGSDEGPECRRPPAVTAPVKPIQPNVVQQQLPRPVLQPLSVEQNPVPMPKPIFQPDLQQQELRGLQLIHNREDPMTAPKPWPRPMGELQPSYIDAPDSRIFNHKGGLQIQSNISPPQYPDSIPDTSYIPNIPRPNQYMPLPGNYQSGPPQQQQWDPRMSPPQRPIWPQQQQQMPQPIQPAPIPQVNLPPQQQQPVATPISADQSKQPAETPKEPAEAHGKTAKSSEEYETYDDQYQDSKASTSGEEQESEAAAEKPEPKKKQHKHHKHGGEHDHKKKNKSKSAKKDKAAHGGEEHAAPVHEHLKMLRNDLEIEFADHDGQAERPGGAVLSLTLGAILTAALAIMIGCRMKVARRRIRRQGKSSYAHDADFLVNGMYL